MVTLERPPGPQEIDQEEVVQDLQAIALEVETQALILATEVEIETEDHSLATE